MKLIDEFPDLKGNAWELEMDAIGHDTAVHLNESGYCSRCEKIIAATEKFVNSVSIVKMVHFEAIRQAVADYMLSEGCSCCRSDNHGENRDRLGELLNVARYDDDSGYDWERYRSED